MVRNRVVSTSVLCEDQRCPVGCRIANSQQGVSDRRGDQRNSYYLRISGRASNHRIRLFHGPTSRIESQVELPRSRDSDLEHYLISPNIREVNSRAGGEDAAGNLAVWEQ